MALHTPVAASVERTTDIAPASGDYSCTFWFKPTAATSAAGGTLFLTVNDVNVYTNWVGIFNTPSTFSIYLEAAASSSAVSTSAVTLQESMYSPIGYVRAGTTHRFYANGILIGSVTKDVSAATFLETWMTNGDPVSNATIGDAQYFREWTNDLTLAELIDEWNSPTPVRTADLFTDTPLANDYLDDSGNGHTWTAIGSPSFVTGAIPVPLTNTSSGAAASMTTSASVVQVPRDAGGTTHTVWFTFTPLVPTQVVVGVWAFGDLAQYKPRVLTSGLLPTITGNANGPIQMPVSAGTPMTLQVQATGGAPSFAVLNLSLLEAPSLDIPSGSILVNDDTPGFPGTVFSSTTDQTVLRYLPNMAAGENGAILVDGSAFVLNTIANAVDPTAPHLLIYNADLEQSGSVVLSIPTQFLATNGTDRFYASDDAGAVRRFNADGVLDPDTWTLTLPSFLLGMAVAPDDSVLYYTGASLSSAVKAWDLVNDTSLGTFAAAPSGYTVSDRELQCLQDGTVIVAYHKAPDLVRVVCYDDAGMTVSTADFTGYVTTTQRLATGADDPTSFWLWIERPSPNAQLSDFVHIRTVDGVTLDTVTMTEYEVGKYGGTSTLTPSARFGMSESCPFLILRSGIAPPPPTPSVTPPYHTLRMGEALDSNLHPNTLQEPRLRRSPHVNSDHKHIFAKLFELDLQPGMGLATGQGVDPIVMLRVSRDGGQTWSQERQMHVGGIGQYLKRCRALQLGSGRDLVFEVRVSDPVAWQIAAAYLEAEEGTN